MVIQHNKDTSFLLNVIFKTYTTMSIINQILETAINEPNFETAVDLFGKAYTKSRGEGNNNINTQFKVLEKQINSNIAVLDETIELNNNIIADSASFKEAQQIMEINFNLIQLKKANLNLYNTK